MKKLSTTIPASFLLLEPLQCGKNVAQPVGQIRPGADGGLVDVHGRSQFLDLLVEP